MHQHFLWLWITFLQCAIQLLNYPLGQQMGIALVRHLPSKEHLRYPLENLKKYKQTSAFSLLGHLHRKYNDWLGATRTQANPNSYGSGSVNYSQRFSNLHCVPDPVLSASPRPWLPHPPEKEQHVVIAVTLMCQCWAVFQGLSTIPWDWYSCPPDFMDKKPENPRGWMSCSRPHSKKFSKPKPSQHLPLTVRTAPIVPAPRTCSKVQATTPSTPPQHHASGDRIYLPLRRYNFCFPK